MSNLVQQESTTTSPAIETCEAPSPESIDHSAVGWLTRFVDGDKRKDVRCLKNSTRVLKRVGDLFVACTLLILLFPLMVVVGLAVRFSSPGPAIFRQERTGLNLRRKRPNRRRTPTSNLQFPDRRVRRNDRRLKPGFGKPFVLYKFRTMRIDAEKNGAQFAVKGDPRVTKLGRFMRKTRLDELPQLWNVIRGDMSLVGPRPERPEFIRNLSEEIPDYLLRLGLRPGLTGIAQVVNGYDNDIESFRRKVAYDLMYLQTLCLWNDVKILFRTIGIVLTGKGAL